MPSAADALPSWVWVPVLAAAGEALALDPATAHHVHRVCRARPGDGVTLTDGHGGVAFARLEDVRPATVRIERVTPVAPPPGTTLWCGAPEGDRADWLIEKLAEIGIATFQPVDAARARWDIPPRRAERWQRLARAALQQSCGAWLLDVRPPMTLAAALEARPSDSAAWLADPAGDPPGLASAEGAWVGAVGPSPGFTTAERDSLIARGFAPIVLARRRLRTETAALALAAWRSSAPVPTPREPGKS